MIHLHSVMQIDGCCLTHAYVCRYGIAALDVLTYMQSALKLSHISAESGVLVITDKSVSCLNKSIKIHNVNGRRIYACIWQKMTYQMIYTVLILEYHVKIGNSISHCGNHVYSFREWYCQLCLLSKRICPKRRKSGLWMF